MTDFLDDNQTVFVLLLQGLVLFVQLYNPIFELRALPLHLQILLYITLYLSLQKGVMVLEQFYLLISLRVLLQRF